MKNRFKETDLVICTSPWNLFHEDGVKWRQAHSGPIYILCLSQTSQVNFKFSKTVLLALIQRSNKTFIECQTSFFFFPKFYYPMAVKAYKFVLFCWFHYSTSCSEFNLPPPSKLHSYTEECEKEHNFVNALRMPGYFISNTAHSKGYERSYLLLLICCLSNTLKLKIKTTSVCLT